VSRRYRGPRPDREGGRARLPDQGGIALYSDLPEDRKLDHIRIIRVDVSNFRNGLEIGGGRGATGFRGVLISSSTHHHNMEAGRVIYGSSFTAARPT
jgi:hypothetical protein